MKNLLALLILSSITLPASAQTIRKGSDGSVTVFHKDGTSTPLDEIPTSMSDAKATIFGYKSYSHGVTYNGGNAPTITLASGGGTLSSIDNSSFIPYLTQAGVWRLRGNFTANVSNTTRTNAWFAIAGVGIALTQAAFGASQPGTNINRARAGSDQIQIDHASGSTTAYYVSFDIRITSKPTWAY
jgi:hypothetical protein